MGSFRELDISIQYTGMGQDLLLGFVRPVLGEAVKYDRITSFFSTNSLLAIADGIESLRTKKGKMRLVLGIHDIPSELLHAACSEDEFIVKLIKKASCDLLSQVATLEDILVKDRLAAIAWMMVDGLLEVRVAAPAHRSKDFSGIFHNKSFVFYDQDNNVVAAVGSANETVAGLGSNHEEITVFMSWQDPIGYVKKQVEKFEDIWSGRTPNLIVRSLERDFAKELLAVLGEKRMVVDEPPVRDLLSKILAAAQSMPIYSIVSGYAYGLYPHQERAFLDSLSRTPIRVMMADEVGFGKTIELGAVIAHALKFRGVKRVVALAPKNLLPQWQEEMAVLFGLDFWIYDSTSKIFSSYKGSVKSRKGGAVLSEHTPELVLISAQYARGYSGTTDVFTEATVLPDLLVVDEAHTARVRPDLRGQLKPTRMWSALQSAANKVDHLILLTATPMQTDWHEYHALLSLLGLPPRWKKAENYERSLHLLITESEPSLDQANKLNELLLDVMKYMRPATTSLAYEELGFLRCLMGESQPLKAAVLTQSKWKEALAVFTKLHPAHLLTIRNTREVMTGLGYKFPERVLEAPALPVTDEIALLNRNIEEYLSRAYFSVERARYANRNFNIGFVLCSYQQRLASSFYSCQASLRRRLEKLISNSDEAIDVSDEDVDSDSAEFLRDDGEIPIIDELERAINLEKSYIKGILSQLESVMLIMSDPKMTELVRVVQKHLHISDKILVFSRYTDTLDAAVKHLSSLGAATYNIAYYTGQASWMEINGQRQPASRETIKKALQRGTVRVVFCSDAASEGLNLQAARVLINLDVPWNPARLEQRIGRIARLGQSADKVHIYNFWYPDSVEARIYGRLINRRDLFELAVGQFPQIISQSIRDEISQRLIPSASQTGGNDDPLERLQGLRQDLQLSVLKRIWRWGMSASPISGDFRDKLIEIIEKSFDCKKVGDGQLICHVKDREIPIGLAPGESNCISLANPIMECLKTRTGVRGVGADIGVLKNNASPICFVIRTKATDDWRVLTQDSLADLMKALVLATPFNITEHSLQLKDMVGSVLDDMDIGQRLSWGPRDQGLSVPTPVRDSAPSCWDGPYNIEILGQCELIGS